MFEPLADSRLFAETLPHLEERLERVKAETPGIDPDVLTLGQREQVTNAVLH